MSNFRSVGRSTGVHTGLLVSLSLLVAVFAAPSNAQTNSSWINATGNWSNVANWDNGVPNGDYNVFLIGENPTYTVNLDINATVDYLYLCSRPPFATGCGTLDILPGRTLTVLGSLNDTSGGTMTGSGTIIGNVNLNGNYGGGIQINQGDSLSIHGDVLNQETVRSLVGSGGSLTIGGSLENGASMTVDGGAMTVGGDIVNRFEDLDYRVRFVISNGGIVNVNGSFINQYESTPPAVSVSSGSVLNVAKDFNNLGLGFSLLTQVSVVGGSSLNVGGNLNNLNNVDNYSTPSQSTSLSFSNGSTFAVQKDLNNTGTLTLATSSAGEVNGSLNNSASGSVQIDSTSALTVKSGFNQSGGSSIVNGLLNAPGAGVSVQGGTLSGTGIINGNVRMSGIMSPGDATGAGTLTINGNYTETSVGALMEQIGSQSWPNSSLLQVNGIANLDGTLSLSLLNGYNPSVGDSFMLMTFLQEYGSFNTITGLNLGNNEYIKLFYDPHDIRVEVAATPEPGSALLLLIGLMAILAIYYKRVAV